MKIRTIAAATGLCVAVLTGCGGSVAGQAQIASGAVLPTTSKSAPSPFPDPTSTGSTTGESSSTDSTSGDSTSTGSTDTSETSDSETSDSTSESTSGSTADSQVTDNTPTQESTSTDDSSVGPTSATSIPGFSKDCNTVLAGITAFSKLLQGAGSTTKISQATVDEALQDLPQSGLPARPQADITVLRATVSAAAGKTLAELGATMTDGKVIEALKDLSSWSQENCG